MGISKASRVTQRFRAKIDKRNRRIMEHQNKISDIADRPNFTSVNQSDKALLKNQQDWINSFGMSEDNIMKSNIIIPYMKKQQVKKTTGRKSKSQSVIGEGPTESEMYGRSYTPTGYLDLGY